MARTDVRNEDDPGNFRLAPVPEGGPEIADLAGDDRGLAHGRGVEAELGDPARRHRAEREAVVVVNHDSKPARATVKLDRGNTKSVEVLQPFQKDRRARLPLALSLPPRSCSVVVADPKSLD
jgi:hypothetical protein